MTSRKLVPFLFVILLSALFVGARPAVADSSHARIIRLSLVQGDVRFARQTHGDPLSDSTATWETAGLNLPIRQGYVLATDNGRAEVEFENGAMADRQIQPGRLPRGGRIRERIAVRLPRKSHI